MRFTKMHGLGNDYVYVDCFQEPFPHDPAALARRVADRHFGVGGDGLIFITPSKVANARMRMFNADGSEAEMCGNGIRCVAKYVFDHGIASERRLKIETGNGVLTLEVEVDGGKVSRVNVDMGEPILEAGKIPVDIGGPADAKIVDVPLAPHITLSARRLSARPQFLREVIRPRSAHDVCIDGQSTCNALLLERWQPD